MKFPEFLEKRFKDKKKLLGIFLILFVGILLIILSAAPSSGEAKEGGEQTLEEYKARLEGELAEICSSVRGVGKCRVMITFERGAENSYRGSQLIESKPPRVLGVSVICRGGDSAEVKSELCELISALFDIGRNRIAVLKLNS